MHRRSMLSWLGMSTAGAIYPLSSVAASANKEGTRIVSLESFCAKDIDHLPSLHSYLSETLDPAMQQAHGTPALYLESIIAPKAPQVVALTSYVSFDEMLAVRDWISSSPNVRQARAHLESSHSLREVQAQVLVAPQGSFELPVNPALPHKSVVELSAFSAPAWYGGPSARVTEVLGRACIHPLANALNAPGEHLSQLTFLIPFESVGASIEAWAKLDTDAEWDHLQREFKLKLTAKAIYKLAPYSRLA